MYRDSNVNLLDDISGDTRDRIFRISQDHYFS